MNSQNSTAETTLRIPEITPLRDASVGFGLWPWAKGPLWRLEEPWTFTVFPINGAPLSFMIPKGYEFDKASVPSFLWGFPFNYTPDGLCVVPALEHDLLCDLYHGGSAWLHQHLGGDMPASPPAAVIHRHFYDRLLAWGVRPSKARTMWEGVRNFGPGGRAWPVNWFKRSAAAILALSACLMLGACGTTRAQRFVIYGLVLEATGHPELGVPVGAIGRVLENSKGRGRRSGK